MDVFEGHRRLDRALRAPAIALGNFDGVHLGHQHLLARARALAAGGELCVLTFEPHPARLLAPERAPRALTTRARKLELLAAAGVDACVVEPFDDALSQRSPAGFAELVLQRGLGARHVVVGTDFRFGHGRAGTAATLAELGRSLGFTATAVDALVVGGAVASSSRIRALLAAGDVGAAAAVLGRTFDVEGEVVRGAGRGKGLGVPTANVATSTETLPQPGIYAVWAERLARAPGVRLAGAASLGTNPTFGAGALTLEVHLVDWDGDLYGEPLRVGFVERLRGEERFPDVASLVRQMERDLAAVRRLLGPRPGTHPLGTPRQIGEV